MAADSLELYRPIYCTDPLFTPEQRFVLECAKTRKKGETSKYLAESCKIHMSNGDCLGTEPIGANAEHGYVGQGSCNAEPVLMLWNIRKCD